MSRLDELIAELCPNGVEYRTLAELAQISAGGDLPNNYVKGQIAPTEQYPYPIYSNGTADGALYGYSDSYKIEQEAITVSARGTIGYHEIRKGKFTPIVRLITLIVNESIVTTKFLNYALYVAGIEGVTTGIPSLTVPMLKKSVVPVPPLTVQRRIVHILDNFTELTVELTTEITTELTARKKQYEYYRDKLLNFGDAVPRMTLGKIGPVCMCKRILKSQTNSTEGVPFYKIGTFGKEANAYISWDTFREYKQKYNFPKKGDILISAAGTIGRTVVYDGKPAYFQDSNIVWIANDETKVLNKFLIYCYAMKPWNVSTGGTIARLYNDNILKATIPVPSLEQQRLIVTTLEHFDALCNDLSDGLPAEIDARQKQYEYHRDKLLIFKKLA